MLEQSLAKIFAERTAVLPIIGDSAAAAILRARRTRRRRAATSGLAAVVALAGLVVGAGRLRAEAQPQGPTFGAAGSVADVPFSGLTTVSGTAPQDVPAYARSAGPAAPVVLDRYTANAVYAADGTFAAFAVGDVSEVRRVPSGWLYGTGRQVRLLKTVDSRVDDRLVAGEVAGWTVDEAGARVAYVSGRSLHQVKLADLAAVGKGTGVSVPAGVVPVGYAGSWIVISKGGSGAFDVLHGIGPYRPTWNARVAAVYGAVGEKVVGLVRDAGGDRFCLAGLEPTANGLVVHDPAGCGLGLKPGAPAVLSPDGSWLAITEGNGVALVNVEAALSGGRQSTVECGVPVDVPPVWTTPAAVAVAYRGVVTLCGTDGTTQHPDLPVIEKAWKFVPYGGTGDQG